MREKLSITNPNRKSKSPNSNKIIGDAFKRWIDNPQLKSMKIKVGSGEYSTEVELER